MRRVRGKQKEPLLMMIYGQPGIGKTTFASHAPNPVFIGDEENKEFDNEKIIVDKFDDTIKAIDEILKENVLPRTIVIDSISSLEDKLRREIIEDDPRGKEFASINQVHGGYGRGVDRMVFREQKLINKIREANKACYNVIILCHSLKDTEEDATLLKANTFYRPSLERKTLRVWEKWLPMILFARDRVILDSDSAKTKTLSDKRVLYTEYRASHYAKNRYNLPPEVEFKKDTVLDIIKAKDIFYGTASSQPVEKTAPKSGNTKNTKKTEEKVSVSDQKPMDIMELKDIYNRIPEKQRPTINWAKINPKNYEKSKQKLMELAT